MKTAGRRTSRQKPARRAAHAVRGHAAAVRHRSRAVPARHTAPSAEVAVLEAAPPAEAMPRAEEWAEVPCPHCGEQFEVLVSADEDGHTRYEDCSVCCRTVVLHVTWEDGETQVEADRA